MPSKEPSMSTIPSASIWQPVLVYNVLIFLSTAEETEKGFLCRVGTNRTSIRPQLGLAKCRQELR